MKKTGYAYFIKRPRRIEELMLPHDVSVEMPYEICRVIELKKIDYENFITDMLVDRQFIENNSVLCLEKERKCLLIMQYGRSDGILVFPMKGCMVKSAAYYCD